MEVGEGMTIFIMSINSLLEKIYPAKDKLIITFHAVCLNLCAFSKRSHTFDGLKVGI